MSPTALAPASDKQHQSGGLLEYVSASRLKTFHECRLKFYFRYVERIPTPTAPGLFVGTVVHEVLRHWNLRRWRKEQADVETLRPLFAKTWAEGRDKVEWDDKEETHREKAWNILEHYLRHSPIPLDERPEAVEVVVDRDFISAGLPPLKGVIDLVREGGRIVDFKTTARSPDQAMAAHLNEIQLSCYAVLYREATGQRESGMELHHLVKTKQPKLVITNLEPMTPYQGRRLMKVMESYVAGIETEDYVPSPGQHCSWCEFREQCRKWS